MKKGTGSRAASAASKVLHSPSSGVNSKKAAASTLAQTKSPKEQTSKAVATAASKVLTDGRTSEASKTAAASALSQRRK